MGMGIIFPHYVPAQISVEAAAEKEREEKKKSPTVLEIYPSESPRLNAVKRRWRGILSEETWWLSRNKELN